MGADKGKIALISAPHLQPQPEPHSLRAAEGFDIRLAEESQRGCGAGEFRTA